MERVGRMTKGKESVSAGRVCNRAKPVSVVPNGRQQHVCEYEL